MLVTLGFLAASLLALAIVPALARRADRLARRRAERQFPLSLEEIAADRDRLRADLAVRERLAEQRAEAARTERVIALKQLGERDMRVAALGRELEDRDARLSALGADLEQVRTELAQTVGERDATIAERDELRDTAARLDGILAERERELGGLMSERDALRVEQIEIRTRLMVVEGERDELKDALAAMQERLRADGEALAAMTTDRDSERLRADTLDSRVRQAERALADAEAAAAAREAQITQLTARLAEEEAMRENDASARTALHDEIARLKASLDAAAAQRAEQVEALEHRLHEREGEIETVHAELRTAQGALAQARSDRAKLKRELARQPKGQGEDGSPDNAALRREIVDVAERLMAMTPKREAAE